MQNFKDVCGSNKSVWFEIQPNESKKFLKWAKDLGCKWIDGKEIDVNQKVAFFHFSITKDGELAYVPAIAWVKEKHKFNHYEFKFLKDDNVEK